VTHPTLVPPNVDRYRLVDARIPVDLLDATPPLCDADRLHRCDLVVEGGRIAAIVAPGTSPTILPAVALDQGLVLPRFVDIHTHLDKGHIWQRAPNPDGTFLGARSTVAGDREANWHAEDVRRRMAFALRCAFAHGTAAIRTHIDSIGPQTAISWPVFDEMRAAWKGRIALQAVALFPTVFALDEPEQFKTIVATVARFGGALGGLTFMGAPPDEKLARALDLTLAARP
jgi:cytosine/creatinine deaminase